MRERVAVPGISDRHERAVALEQVGWRGRLHCPTARFDHLRLAPHCGRGHRRGDLVPVGEDLLVLGRGNLRLADRVLPPVPEKVHRLHPAHHLRHQHPRGVHP